MLFNTWAFALLMLLTTFFYYLKSSVRYQVSVLITASLLFYAYGNLELLVLLLLSALVNALTSYYVAYGNNKKILATLGVVVNLLLLAFFKYNGMMASLFDTQNGIGAFLLSIPLPLGISFYTFRGISLVVDVFRGTPEETEKIVDKSLSRYLFKTLFFVSFFPALVAGPIIKAHDFFQQIKPKRLSDVPFTYVFKTLIVGFFLKMVIADNLKDFTFWMAYPYFEARGTGSLLLMLLGYSAQIFADFAGYSLIAIGLGAILGYKLPTNFNFPYISTSVREFWKRWHISLSEFLMEYLYFSMGGSRKGKLRTYINLLLTMMLGGLWHGAALSYVVWGTYHGLLLVLERLICGKRECLVQVRNHLHLSRFASVTSVYLLVALGWLLFVLPDFSQAVGYLRCIISPRPGVIFLDPKLCPIALYMLPVIAYHLLYYFRNTRFVQHCIFRYSYLIYGALLYLIITNSGSTESFVYFQF